MFGLSGLSQLLFWTFALQTREWRAFNHLRLAVDKTLGKTRITSEINLPQTTTALAHRIHGIKMQKTN